MTKFDPPMAKWTELLTDHYNTHDTIPMVKVEGDELHLMQGTDLIVLSVSEFFEFVEGVRDAIKEARS